jgi:hypothetical protein
MHRPILSALCLSLISAAVWAAGFHDVAFVASLNRGAASGGGATCNSCAASPAFSEAGVSDTTLGTAVNSSVHRTGQVWTNGAATTNLCAWSFEVTRSGGDVSTKNFRVRVYSMTGNNLNALVGQSDTVLGTNAWLNTVVKFPFSTSVALSPSTPYAIVLYPDEGVDGVNVVAVGYKNTGMVSSGYVAYFDSSGVQQSTPGNGADAVQAAYFCE